MGPLVTYPVLPPSQLPTLIKVPMRDDLGRAYATGRRKTSAARVWVKRGDGNIVVNGFSFVEYFPRVAHRTQILYVFVCASYLFAIVTCSCRAPESLLK